MNKTPPSLSAPVPAAERAWRMEETLADLEAGAAEILAGWPRLLRLLMQLFQMLRDAADKLAVVQDLAPVSDEAVAVVGGQDRAPERARAAGKRRVRARRVVQPVATRVVVAKFVRAVLRHADRLREQWRGSVEAFFLQNALWTQGKTASISLR